MSKKVIYLIRHTKPAIDKAICYGQSDMDVEASFYAESEEINKVVEPLDAINIYSSPLKRCAKLAKSLYPDLQITYSNDLKELDFGSWEMQKWTDIPKQELSDWGDDFCNSSPPNGESFTNLHKRVTSFWNHLLCREESNYAIIAHAGVIRSILATLLDMPLENVFRIKLNYGCVIKLVIYSTHPEIEFVKTN